MQVSSEKNVETLLDEVNLKVFTYTCEQTFCNNTVNQQYHFQHPCLTNASCCFSNNHTAIFPSQKKCDPYDCKDFLQSSAFSHWYIFLVFGLLCLCGNFVVISQKITCLCNNRNQHKNVVIYNILVLNLSIANLLMGIYLIAISLEISRKLKKNIYFSSHGFCSFLGIICSLSTQMSISILAIISFCRLISIKFPYKKQHVKLVVGILISMWLIWLAIASLPVIPLEPLASVFTVALARDSDLKSGTFIAFFYTRPFLENLTFQLKFHKINSILEAIRKYPTISILSKLHDQFGWVDLERENWALVGYYDSSYICSTSFFIDYSNFQVSDYFTLSYVFADLILSIAVIVIYLYVTLTVSSDKKIACTISKSCKTKKIQTKCSPKRHGNLTARNVENQKIYRRISIIIITDMVFVIPLCLAVLALKLVTFDTGNDILKQFSVTQTLLLFFVPFNSIINPYIYSFQFWKNYFKYLKNKIKK